LVQAGAGKRKLSLIYGFIHQSSPDEGALRSPDDAHYIVPLHLLEVIKNEDHRPRGMCFMQLVVAANVPIPALGITATQRLEFGRTVPVTTELRELLPFNTGVYGFQEMETGTTVGYGEFFATLVEATTAADNLTRLAKSVRCVNLVPAP
jgi:hypothetical protein